MKAVVRRGYGSAEVLAVDDVEEPVVRDDDVLVRVRAASLNAYDVHVTRGKPYFMRLMTGLRRPRSTRLGQDLAGVVEAVGRNVTTFRPGDEVFGSIADDPALEIDRAFAELARVPESALVRKPASRTFEEVAAVPMAARTALQGLRDCGALRAGHRALINGASGGVGTFAVQIAKALGAEVTAVCSTANVERVRELGADRVIDYTREDYARTAERYDVVLDVACTRSISTCRALLAEGGTYVYAGAPTYGAWLGPFPRLLAMRLRSSARKKLVLVEEVANAPDLVFLSGLMESGKMRSVIDRRFALREIQPALRHVATGHARGKVVIDVS